MSTLYRQKDFNPSGILPVSIKGMDGKQGIVQLYASSFNNVDQDGDVILPGAFTKSLEERGPNGNNSIVHLYQHMTGNIVGKPTAIYEDGKGLFVESRLSMNTTDGRNMMGRYMDELITQHSIGFKTIKEEAVDGVNYIKEVMLFEYSGVTWGANENTPTIGMKTAEKKQELTQHIEALQKAIRRGTYTDDFFPILELELERVKALLLSLDEQPEQSTVESEPIGSELHSITEKIEQWTRQLGKN